MKNKEFWDGAGKVLLIMALVIALTSLALNISSRMLEKNARQAYETTAATEETSVINIMTSGMLDYGTNSGSASDYSSLFSNVKDMIGNYDLAVSSQKTLVGSQVPNAFGDAVKDAGFNMIGLANPDCLLNGKDGIDTSMSYWNSTDIHTAGTNTSTDAQNKIETFTVNNMTIAFLSFTDSVNDTIPDSEQYLVNVYDDEKSPQLVEKADEAADVVVVDICWNGQDGQQPTERQQSIAKALADAGASVIVGNAPDAIQPVAWIDDTLIFYSMGNLVSDSSDQNERMGLVGAVTITKTVSGDRQKIELFNPRVDMCASVSGGSNGYTVKLFDSITEEELSDKDQIYSDYSSVLLSMDDSIRIGGLE